MRTGKKGTGWSQLWKRNAVVAAHCPIRVRGGLFELEL